MRIHEFILIPGAGHAGSGVYDRGHVTDALAEVDLVDRVVQTIIEELDNSLVRYRLVNTRKAPGTPLSERYSLVFPHCLPIAFKIGMDAKKVRAMSNVSMVWAHTSVPNKLASEIADVMRHWGSLYVHGHRTANIGEQEDQGITLSPFQINGRHAEEYARHLPKLGRDLGRMLVDFCRARQDDAAVKFTSNPPVRGRAYQP